MAHSPGVGAMNKGLPTSRAGGSTSRYDLSTSRIDDGANRNKTALKTSFFSHNHFSSSLDDTRDPMLKRTRVAVKVLEGKDLLVSDLPTGTSDPVACVWVGPSEEGDVDLQKDQRIQTTEIRKHTVDPVWDAEFVFPLDVLSADDVLSGRVNVTVRDYDDADGDVHYFHLGKASISLEEVIVEGNIMAHTQLVQLPARWYTLQRCRGMRKVTGALKIAVGFFAGTDSNLWKDVDQEGGGDQRPSERDEATCFERHIKRIRGSRGRSTAQTAFLSPSHRTRGGSRTLTARGGTVRRRPRSAPEATTLTSPIRDRQGPFELKPLRAKFPADGYTEGAKVDPSDTHPNTRTTAGENLTAHALATAVPETKPRWRDTYGSPKRYRHDHFSLLHVGAVDTAFAGFPPARSLGATSADRNDLPAAKWTVNDPSFKPANASTKLSRLAAKAAEGTGADGLRSVSVARTTNCEEDGAIMRAHRWHRRLLLSMQRLEERSTEAMAYGELRAMVREANATQVAQIIAAARGVGAACSLSARRCTIKLLSWLCWDQPRAASKLHAAVIAYALDRIRDPESASIRPDLAASVGAVMLSALRNGTANACMVQTQRFLELVREQRVSVRESAGICFSAAVLPPLPPVAVEIDTSMRSIDDVRMALSHASERVGITTLVPKESVLLPDGRVVIEMTDASSAAEFHDQISTLSAGLATSWRPKPFPERFCDEVNRAEIAHAARLTVNSEEILASLLEALDSSRTEGTRAPLLDAIAAMARSSARHDAELARISPAEVDLGKLPAPLAATLMKGLPAIARAVQTILGCPIRRSYTWRERVAALETTTCLASLAALRGPDGPLGQHRSRVVKGCARGKHDSVASVRQAAARALLALEATTEEQRRKKSGVAGSWGSAGSESAGGKRGVGMSVAEMRKSYRALQRGTPKAETTAKKPNNLHILVDRATRVLDNDTIDNTRSAPINLKLRDGSEEEQPALESATRGGSSEAQLEVLPPALSSNGSSPQSDVHKGIEKDEIRTPVAPIEKNIPLADIGQENLVDDESQKKQTNPRGAEGGIAQEDFDGKTQPPERREHYQQNEGGENKPIHVRTVQRLDENVAALPFTKQHEAKGVVIQPAIVDPLAPQPVQPVQPGQSLQPVRSFQTMHGAQPAQEMRASPALYTAQLQEGVVPAALAGSGRDPIPGPRDCGVQVDTVRLLRHLNEKSDTISIVLSSLDQRLVGMEKSLVERLQTAESPTRVPPRRRKRHRSSRHMDVDPNHPTARPNSPSKHVTSPAAAAASGAAAAASRSASHHRRLRRDMGRLISLGHFEGAFRLALGSGNERDVLRLMGTIAGGPAACRRLIGMETRDKLFAFVARAISAGQYAEHVLPCVFEIVQAGEARSLPFGVRMQLAGALHGLAACPTDQGVMAARLGPYLSLTALGRASLSDVSEGGELFRVLVAGEA